MANSRKSGRSESRFPDVSFVDLSLTKKQEQSLIDSAFSKSLWVSFLDNILEEGNKITIKRDKRNNTVMAMVQSEDYDPDAVSVIYVMRSSSGKGALLKLAFYWDISDGTLPDTAQTEPDKESDDELFV